MTHPEELVDELPPSQQQTHDDEARVEAQLLQHEVGACSGTGTGSRHRARKEDSLRLRKHRGVRDGDRDGERRVKQLIIDTGGRLGALPPADQSGSRDTGRNTFALHFRVVGARPDRRVERERLLQIARLACPQAARETQRTDGMR